MTFDIILNKTEILLKEKNIMFSYQRRGCKKHGHFKKKINKITNKITYELKIEKEDNNAAKIYTYIHELSHMLNNHLDNKSLTYAQKEWVVHEISMYYIRLFNLNDALKNSKLNNKWDIINYGNKWLENRTVTEKKYKIMEEQVINTIKLLNAYIKG